MAKGSQQTVLENNILLEAPPISVAWQAIIGGAVITIAVSIVLLILGSALGFATVSPWPGSGASLPAFTGIMAFWLIVTQWGASALGGYITGRLRGRYHRVHNSEVFFRDTAHGFISWAVATLFTALFLTTLISNIVGGAAQGAGKAALFAGHEAARQNNGKPAAQGAATHPQFGNTGYYIENLYRSDKPNNAGISADNRTETNIIVGRAYFENNFNEEDKNYLKQLVIRQTGVNDAEASRRVDRLVNQIAIDKAKAKEATDKARKAASLLSFTIALSMALGAFIASVAAGMGGIHRDRHDSYKN